MLDNFLTLVVIFLALLTLHQNMKNQENKNKEGAEPSKDQKSMLSVLLTMCISLLLFVSTLGYIFFAIGYLNTAFIIWGSCCVYTMIMIRYFRRKRGSAKG